MSFNFYVNYQTVRQRYTTLNGFIKFKCNVFTTYKNCALYLSQGEMENMFVLRFVALVAEKKNIIKIATACVCDVDCNQI